MRTGSINTNAAGGSNAIRRRWRVFLGLWLVASLGGTAGPLLRASEGQPVLHWAFQPLVRPKLPALPAGNGPTSASAATQATAKNPIDVFVLARLAEAGLTLSPPAGRRTWLRRVYFDLIGLPPTPEEMHRFEQDRSPDAYERIVDQLLASPHYGEQWARHWLDVVRFAETHGFEMNQPRPAAWPYRDYVIRAFNQDKPYDRFILEQLAGDVLGADEATGFLVGGAWDQVKSPDPVLTANQRADELHDIVSTTCSALLGLTVGCARCHNHKFDPIPQTDYYGIRAVFEGVQHGERRLRPPENEERDRELAQDRAALEQIEQQLERMEPLAQVGRIDTNHLRAPVNPRRNVERFPAVTARRLRFTIHRTSASEPCLDELEVFSDGPENLALVSRGTKTRASSVYPNSEIHRLEHLNDGKYGNSRSWISNERDQGWVELEFSGLVSFNRVVWGRDREQKFADRLAVDYLIEVASGSNDWSVIASSADRQPYKPGAKPSPDALVAALTPAQAGAARDLISRQRRIEARLAELARTPMVYGGMFAPNPEPTHRLYRGDPLQPREVIAPSALQVVPVKFDLASATNGMTAAFSENQRRRLALARWIVAAENPLTARVIANRLWQYHFGEGLAGTPSDFGANGARPTHPQLLDWLASELMQPLTAGAGSGNSQGFAAAPWSLKHLQRLIVTSATYRQASDLRPDGLAADASARLLWRFPSRRLDAEPLRDSILAVSGKLDLRMGGPGFSFFEPNDNYVRVYAPRKDFGPPEWRRMVYGTVVRQRPDGVFGVFDCPDGGQIAPKRNRSTTPLQALNLLNSRFILQQSGFLAERLRHEAGERASDQARRAFELCFNRLPERDELVAAEKVIQADGLPVFCRALFNANEFAYLF